MPPRSTETGHSNTSLVPWSVMFNANERTPEFMSWSSAARVYDDMVLDSQIAGVMRSTVLPILGYRWMLDPMGASDEVVERVGRNLNIEVKGREVDRPTRRRGRFSFGEHLRTALFMLRYGGMFFEQSYRQGDDEFWNLRKLAPRFPHTISKVNTERDGGLESIEQYAYGGGSRLIVNQVTPEPIPVTALVAYTNDKVGDVWSGTSVLRSVFRNWLLKDQLLRIDAIKHERNGLGVPKLTAPPNASQRDMDILRALGEQFKVGEFSNAVLPSGADLELVGTSGSIPDTMGSVRYHDEQISKNLLNMMMELGTSQTGSRALGDTFANVLDLSQQSIAGNFAEVFNAHVIEDLVDWNYGEDEPAPQLVFEAHSDERIAVAELVSLVQADVVRPTPELEEYVNTAWNLPQSQTVIPLAVSASQRRRKPERVEAKASAGGRELRRNLYAHEVQAATDFNALEIVHRSRLAALVTEWLGIRSTQIESIVGQIEQAGSDPVVLSRVTAPVLGAEVIAPYLIELANSGVDSAMVEASAQGLGVGRPSVDLAVTAGMAGGIAAVMASSLSASAQRKAVELASFSGASEGLAQSVREHLDGLSDAYPREVLGGAVTQAQNYGRFSVMEQAPVKKVYASELLDSNTCSGGSDDLPRCMQIDGTEYESMEDAMEDYPSFQYRYCLGGGKCRGTLVAIYEDEVDQDPTSLVPRDYVEPEPNESLTSV